jgi:hypothetical protein
LTLPKPSRRLLIAVAGLLLVAACSPKYDWRELVVADGQVRAVFPARVQTEKRDIDLAGQRIAFSLSAANVGDSYFAVGYAPFPGATAQDEATRTRLGEELIRSLYVNLHVSPPDPLPAFGSEVEVRSIEGEPRWSLAKVWVTDHSLIEVVALGSVNSLPREEAHDFVRQANLPGIH